MAAPPAVVTITPAGAWKNSCSGQRCFAEYFSFASPYSTLFYLLSKAISACTPKERIIFRSTLAISIVAGFFVATNTYYAITEEIPAHGGSFTEGFVGQPTFINPLLSSGSDADESAIELLFPNLDGLIQVYATSTDRKTISITLKKDLVWDDGVPLTADDVVFTVETAQDILVRSPQAGAWQGVIAEKINDNEVRFTLREPSAFFESTARNLKIAPRHIFGAIPAANLRLSAYNLEPVGAGPWKFSEMKTERSGFITEIRLTPNTRYAGSVPFMTNFSLRFYQNEKEAADAFNAKEIEGLGGIDPEQAESLLVEHRLASISLPRYYALFFNSNTHYALKEKEVRQALAAAIDRKKLVTDVFNGHAATAEGPLAPQIRGYDAGALRAGENSVGNAKRLLDSAGWLLNPEDGVRYKTIGRERTKLEFTVIVPEIPNLLRTMDSVKSEWGAIGIKTNITPMSVEDMQRGPIKTRNYEMVVFGNVLKGNPDVFAFWHSSQKFYPGLNLSMYENKTVDAILAGLQKAEVLDITQLKKLQELIHNDAPAAFLMNPNYLYAIPRNLHGGDFETLTTPENRLTKTEEWYVRTRRQFRA